MCKLYFMVGLYVSEVASGFLPTMSFASSSSSAFSQSFGRGIIGCFFAPANTVVGRVTSRYTWSIVPCKHLGLRVCIRI
ncbi:hypothetical protein EDD18DRAFT_1154554, partial [Armillaria luteobubalina]